MSLKREKSKVPSSEKFKLWQLIIQNEYFLNDYSSFNAFQNYHEMSEVKMVVNPCFLIKCIVHFHDDKNFYILRFFIICV